MINAVHVLLVKTTGQIKGQNHAVPGIGVNLHLRVHWFIPASALAKAAVAAPPENVTVTSGVEIG